MFVLASELTGWTLNVMSEDDAEQKAQQRNNSIIGFFSEHLDVDEEVATILHEEGFTTLDEVAYVPVEECFKLKSLTKI